MSEDMNPMGREYTPGEWASARRVGIAPEKGRGPLVYATGHWHPNNARMQADNARKLASDWDRVADAMDREWKKPIP